MQVVISIVGGQRVSDPIKGKRPVSDAVPVAPDHGTEIIALLHIAFKVVIAQHNIVHITVPVGGFQ